jgi:hypothetical protein
VWWRKTSSCESVGKSQSGANRKTTKQRAVNVTIDHYPAFTTPWKMRAALLPPIEYLSRSLGDCDYGSSMEQRIQGIDSIMSTLKQAQNLWNSKDVAHKRIN